jgi:multiple sugar transport system ATP-binding protein
MAFLEISNLQKRFGTVDVLKGINLAVEEGGFLVLVGPSGCGKSTLLNTIAGLESITGGEIRINGRTVNNLHPSQRDIAMVFQSYALYPNMSVGQNIAFGMEMRGVPKAERDKAVAGVAKTLQISHLLASVSRWEGRWCAIRRSSCSTSRSPISTPSCASTCAPKSSACTSR